MQPSICPPFSFLYPTCFFPFFLIFYIHWDLLAQFGPSRKCISFRRLKKSVRNFLTCKKKSNNKKNIFQMMGYFDF